MPKPTKKVKVNNEPRYLPYLFAILLVSLFLLVSFIYQKNSGSDNLASLLTSPIVCPQNTHRIISCPIQNTSRDISLFEQLFGDKSDKEYAGCVFKCEEGTGIKLPVKTQPQPVMKKK